ncbi:PadR family transcriptional regulator [Phenylobacterium sp. SCN 70-31]|uniref:PadR family transcriptional regulator n=1 Tax=Phenylobacterium sp. SCN 70-31 TaxID=1660129 RepID=UPI00086CE661|nr:PadR family transcriptional regulator [Phenylobacterium sp. SCN 70-31]ODT86804.1 MAG: hypothetical protein ABS78_14210 [Phenylobacterium sp. SCN 70-31]
MHRHKLFHDHLVRRGRHGWSGGMGRHGERRGRFGRFFGHGDLRTVILALLEAQPRHGYELIKELEDRTGGAYRPSPGVIYPTLALLEDEGRVRQAGGETGRKLYEISDEGRAELDGDRTAVEALFARMEDAGRHAGPGRPRVERALANLQMALKARMARPVSAEELDRIVGMIDDTASSIERT